MTMRPCVGAVLLCAAAAVSSAAKQPNIIHVIADDLGAADLGYRNPQIRSPNIDKLAAEGTKLTSYYVYRFCSPSRSSFQTGRYPWHIGQQTTMNLNPTPAIACGINRNYTFLGQVMKDAGYNTMALGKWHLGFQTKEYTPTFRGYDEYLGYYSGAEEHFTHEKEGVGATYYDLSRNAGETISPARSLVGDNGTYSSYIYGNATLDFLRKQSTDTPFYIYLAWNNVHAPCEAPAYYENLNSHIQDKNRRLFGGMVTAIDDAMQAIVDQLKAQNMYDNTIIVFTTDNGGNLGGSGSNWPLRGGKYTFWEGGVRGTSFIHSPLLPSKMRGSSWDGLAHAVDWYPTFASLAGVSVDKTGPLPVDGVNIWKSITENTTSAHDHVFIQIDGTDPEGHPTNFTGVVRRGPYKLIVGYPGWGNAAWDGWVPTPQVSDPHHLGDLASQHVPFFSAAYPGPYPCAAKPCLYNVETDPEERHEISDQHQDIVSQLHQLILNEAKSEVTVNASGICPTKYGTQPDPRCNTHAAQIGFWEPWLDGELQ